MSISTPSLHALFQAAHDEGDLSAAALRSLMLDGDYAGQMQGAMGSLTPDDVPAAEVMLVTVLADDSVSLRPLEAAVREGHNAIVAALRGSRQKDGIVMHTAYLSGHSLYPYVRIDDAVAMDAANYAATLHHTPLYDRSIAVLGTVLAQARTFRDAGTPVRSLTLIMTDGADNASRQGAAAVAGVVGDLHRQECHLVVGMGIDDGQTDFRGVFARMGITQVLTPGNSAGEIRAACQAFSRSAVRASQSAAPFGPTSGGFFS